MMNDVVYSVNILIGLGLLGVAWILYYILMLDRNEEKHSPDSHISPSDHE